MACRILALSPTAQTNTDFIVKWTQKNELHWKFNQDIMIFTQKWIDVSAAKYGPFYSEINSKINDYTFENS